MVRIMAVTAHPDDESFLFGGTLALHAQRGDPVALVCLTDGQAGRTGGLCSRAALATVRRAELLRACNVLGIGKPVTPGLQDGGLSDFGEERGIALISSLVADFSPDVLLTFGPEGASGHEDHKATWRWTRSASEGRVLYAATFPESVELRRSLAPTTVVDIAELGDRKRRAFLEHRTQLDHLELFDRIQAAFAGTEHYHRVHPAWQKGAPCESGLLETN